MVYRFPMSKNFVKARRADLFKAQAECEGACDRDTKAWVNEQKITRPARPALHSFDITIEA